jgi:CRISPR-associated endonuclease/helicase Cas3
MGAEVMSYPFQTRIATEPWPDIIKVETGMGKTAGIVLSWLYKRLINDPDTPRRLIYCLPMRVLVEQTAANAREWVEKLINANIIAQSQRPSIYVLMGGEIGSDWDRYPEQDAILIGTQDQLLSRALNRGYAMSRFRWPVSFGLLNSDCLWVMDEVQLMGVGLSTTAQLQAFREYLGTALPTHSLWMSATLQPDWLGTVDFAERVAGLKERRLSQADLENPTLRKRLEAPKPLLKAHVPFDKTEKVAALILDAHQKGTRTLAVFNTVKRAAEIFDFIREKKLETPVVLLHSRFRPGDRETALQRFLADPGDKGMICISTQVVEAGVDVSAETLITDLAPWASMVQRFGRCNRYGETSKAKVFWIEIDVIKKGASAPYSPEELQVSSSNLASLTDVGPNKLPPVSSVAPLHQVLRSKDIIELFDTTPDLAGMDVDVSRFIRETADKDVHVFWRSLPNRKPSENEPGPTRMELCPVPIGDLNIREIDRWRWDPLERAWVSHRNLAPGMVLMLPVSAGGYDPELGWTGDRRHIPKTVEVSQSPEEGMDDDPYTVGVWQTLVDHNESVAGELRHILSHLPQSLKPWHEILLLASYWHDAGKLHDVFQKAANKENSAESQSGPWAKTAAKRLGYERRGFRHELASALAMIENGLPDLAAFLTAAHHGKVRFSMRSFPTETHPPTVEIRFARGIWDGDILEDAVLGPGHKLPRTILDLSFMELGDGPKGPSWTSRVLSLRDDPNLGPFRLAFLEAILRAADWRASMKAGAGHV